MMWILVRRGEIHGCSYVLQVYGTSRPTIRVKDVGPYAQYDPYYQGLPPQGGPSDDISKFRRGSLSQH